MDEKEKAALRATTDRRPLTSSATAASMAAELQKRNTSANIMAQAVSTRRVAIKMSKLKHIYHDKSGKLLFDHPMGPDGEVLRSSISKHEPTSKEAPKPINPYR